MTTPVITGSATAGSGVYTTVHDVNFPANAIGDLVVFHIYVGNQNQAITGNQAGRNNEPTTKFFEMGGSGGRFYGYWYIATDARAAGAKTFTYTNSVYVHSAAYVVQAGTFDPTAPIATLNTGANSFGQSVPFNAYTSVAAGRAMTAHGHGGNTTLAASWPDMTTVAYVHDSSTDGSVRVGTRTTAVTDGESVAIPNFTAYTGEAQWYHTHAYTIAGPVAKSTVGATSLGLAASGTVVATDGPPVGTASITLEASGTVVATDSGGPWLDFTDGVTSSTGATVTGLTGGVSYEFRVAAVNDIGQGPWSATATT